MLAALPCGGHYKPDYSAVLLNKPLTTHCYASLSLTICPVVRMLPRSRSGFTLIELSIVLVIIGLLVGGVLVGRDLIASAAIRAQIGQIEKFNSAINTFRTKYNALPGDIAEPNASGFGLFPRGTDAGQGDGNGIIAGHCFGFIGCACGYCVVSGELIMVWRDLSSAQLLEGQFNTAGWGAMTGTSPSLIFPEAAIGRGNYISLWNKNYNNVTPTKLHYQISAISSITSWNISANPALTVLEANNIDQKIDNALPQTGKVRALYFTNLNGDIYLPHWASVNGDGAHGADGGPTNAATSPSDETCYDNGGVSGIQKYSMSWNGGSGINCAISIIW